MVWNKREREKPHYFCTSYSSLPVDGIKEFKVETSGGKILHHRMFLSNAPQGHTRKGELKGKEGWMNPSRMKETGNNSQQEQQVVVFLCLS